MNFRPTAFDLVAHYEPRADFTISPSIRTGLAKLARQYRRTAMLTGRHGGRPQLHTDLRGMAVGTRMEVTRLALTPGGQVRTLSEAFALFQEASSHRLTSGPLASVGVYLPGTGRRQPERARVRQAFQQVTGVDCCFLVEPRMLKLGRCVIHQSLLQYLREDGPYHSCHHGRVEAVQKELQREPGRYENHRFLACPTPTPDGRPELTFCYTGADPDPLIVASMRQRAGEQLCFIERTELAAEPGRYVTLEDYELASRRFGTLWTLYQDMVRPLEQPHVSTLYLFLDEALEPSAGRWFSWNELFERQQGCARINRALRRSPTALNMSLEALTRHDVVQFRQQQFRLNPEFDRFQHVTFYDLGDYERRLQV